MICLYCGKGTLIMEEQKEGYFAYDILDEGVIDQENAQWVEYDTKAPARILRCGYCQAEHGFEIDGETVTNIRKI